LDGEEFVLRLLKKAFEVLGGSYRALRPGSGSPSSVLRGGRDEHLRNLLLLADLSYLDIGLPLDAPSLDIFLHPVNYHHRLLKLFRRVQGRGS
jgi:hypothetical protein